MNWTEGNLHRHGRGRGWDRDRSRQRRVFAGARPGKTGACKAATGDASPFFSISALGESSVRLDSIAAASPPSAKRRKTSPVASCADDLDSRRRRLLSRPDWTGISNIAPRQESRDTSRHFGALHAAPALHHPRPMRRDGVHLVRSLESRTHRAGSTSSRSEWRLRPQVEQNPHTRIEQSPHLRVAASVGTAETEETDNLLPLSDTLPDVSLRLDILEVGDRCGADDVSLAALLSSQSEHPSREYVSPGCRESRTPGRESLGRGRVSPRSQESCRPGMDDLGPGGIDPGCKESCIPGRVSLGPGGVSLGRQRSSILRMESRGRREFTPEGCDAEDLWLDFIFDDDDEEQVKKGAFEVARRDAARVLVPYVSSGDSRVVECNSGSASGCGGSDRASCGGS